MQTSNGSYTRDALLEFLDFAGKKGLMNKATSVSYRVACGKVLGLFEPAEAADVRSIELDDLFRRYRNLVSGKAAPRTIQTYEARVRKAVGEFIKYRENPSAWKPSGRQRVMRPPASSNGDPKISRPLSAPGRASSRDTDTPLSRQLRKGEADQTIYPFPLRPDTMVRISGLPPDLKRAEARRLAAFLETLAQDFVPDQASPPA